jgi:hypothetical protein
MKKAFDSLDPYPHCHLWMEYEEKDKKTNKKKIVEQCKFCHIVRDSQKK